MSRLQEADADEPYRRGAYFYYSRTEQGKQYPTRCRKAGSLDAPEQVILDTNAMAAGKKFLSVTNLTPSDDGKLLAYLTDEVGFRQFELHVKDLTSGAVLPDKALRVRSFVWAADNKTLYYATEDATTKRANQVWRHVLGGAKDELVYEDKDEHFDVRVDRTRDLSLIVVTSGSLTATEARIFSAKDKKPKLVLVQPREKDHEYYVDEANGQLFIRTNSTGRNFHLVTAPLKTPGKAHWKELLPHRAAVAINDFDVFDGYLVASEREAGLPQLSVLDFKSGEWRRVSFPEASYDASPDFNYEPGQTAYRVRYQSLISPDTVYDIDLKTLERKLLKQTPVPHYDASRYEVERIDAAAPDGVKVPISLVHKKGLVKDGKSPLYLYGYGAYGISIDDAFSSARFSLVDRGVTFAIAHIRGGGELGTPWHDDGRMMKKKNTFTDFIAAAETLIQQGYTSSDRLAIEGRSAGGLLMGAVVNLRPDLFKVAFAGVPFVDVINTMLDESLPLTVPEFEEWGNPKKPDEDAYLRAYSPYDNVAAKAYPALLVRSSYNDSQVMYWEPSKWVARLRAMKTDHNPLVFKCNMDPAGHGGASGRYDKLRDTAWEYAFMLDQLGVK
ncbi:MAG: S9 family peptidase [Deltaproteobacteria bacterium]|nr:S9 family peptidase [Deltaproteobacteria bacterium]